VFELWEPERARDTADQATDAAGEGEMTLKPWSKAVLAVLVTSFAQTALAAPASKAAPYSGYLSNGKNFMKFNCDPPTPQSMSCKFEQVLITPKGGPDDLSKALATLPKAVKEFATDKEMGETCAGVRELAIAIRSGPPYNVPKSTAFLKKFDALTGQERADTIMDIERFEKACIEPTKENVEAMIRWDNKKASKTCTIWLNSYEQTFIQQSPDIWVHTGQAAGICGVIDVSTLERHDETLRKIVTDKNATKDTKIFLQRP
jgi:hypothetical protein